MKRMLILLLCLLSLSVQAQTLTRQYNNVSMAQALRELNQLQHQYTVNFIFNDLEDFRITLDIKHQSVPDAIRLMIGFYPITLTEQGNNLFVECISKGSQRFKGRLVDESGQPMEYANVMLLSVADSSFLAGGVTNASGVFVIPYDADRVIARFSYVGYKTLTRTFTSPNAGTVAMQPDRYTVKTVTVKGHRKTDHVDHATYTFTDEQLKNARHAQDLMATLPGLHIDPISGAVQSLSGKSVKILINGIEATDNDLKELEGKQIRNVDYYVVPPARYHDVGTLINIHTHKTEDGYAAGFDETQGLSSGFNNTNVYAHYNTGHSQLAFDYGLQYRNNGGCNETNIYRFNDEADEAEYRYEGNYHFGYATQNFNLRYLYSLGDSLNFQVKFSPEIFRWFWRTNWDITAQNNPLWANGTAREEQLRRHFAPSLDIYFQKKMAHNQDITLDVVGTYFNNHEDHDNLQHNEADEEVLSDQMRQHNHKYSVIGEVAYTKGWEKMSLSLGYKATLAKSDFTISNVLSDYAGYDYTARDDNHYAYAELSGTLSKLNYRFSLGGTYVHTSNNDTHYNKLYFTPQMLLAYGLKHGMLRLQVFSQPQLPGIAQLSNNTTVVIPGLYNVGNPYLKSGNDNAVKLAYSLQTPYIDFEVGTALEREGNSISNYYTWQTFNGQRVMTSQPTNNDRSISWMSNFQGQLKPFKSEVFTISFNMGAQYDNQKSDLMGVHTHWAMPLMVEADFRKDGWGAVLYWEKKYMTPNGNVLRSNERKALATVFYQHKQLRVGLNGFFLFAAPQYWDETMSNSVFYSYHTNKITSQKNMLTLSLSYNLFSGKQHHLDKKIDNADHDAGSF
jgi:hypothetical protein